MNILIGAHGVGKSTLLKRIGEIYPNKLYITDGVSRPVKLALKELSIDSLYKEQLIINRLTEWNWIQNLSSSLYTSARSVIDSYVYSKALGFTDLAQQSLLVFLQNKPKEINYFYLPIEFPLRDDGVRYTDLEFQRKIDIEIVLFIEKYLTEVTILTGELTSRIKVMSSHLNLS